MFSKILPAIVLSFAASAAFAGEITVEDPYARASSMSATSGAAFMTIHNMTDQDDVLLSASSEGLADRIELHTHLEDENGVMRMREVEGGIPLPANSTVMLQRGGLHVMFLGMHAPFHHGDEFPLTLEFEHADDLEITVPIDLERQLDHGAMHGMKNSH